MNDNYYKVMVRDNFTCQICGNTPGMSGLQLAHKIRQGSGTEKMISDRAGHTKKYVRDKIINHQDNLVTVCSLKCNDACNIYFNDVEREKLLTELLKNC